MSTPTVTVLIDNFNYDRFLGEAIESALNQTHAPLEVLVVDDGSTDDSREVIARFGERVRPILKPNGGQASAFNAGLAASRGDWICLLDADDVWFPEKVERVVNAVRGRTDVAMVRHRLQVFTGDRWPEGRTHRLSPRMARRALHEPNSPRRALTHRRDVPSSAMTVSRRLWSALGPIPESPFRVSADAFLYTFLAMHGRVVDLPDVLGGYRHHGGNLYLGAAAEKAIPIELALRRLVRERTGHEPVLPTTLLRPMARLPAERRAQFGFDMPLLTQLAHLIQSERPLWKKAGFVAERLARAANEEFRSRWSAGR